MNASILLACTFGSRSALEPRLNFLEKGRTRNCSIMELAEETVFEILHHDEPRGLNALPLIDKTERETPSKLRTGIVSKQRNAGGWNRIYEPWCKISHLASRRSLDRLVPLDPSLQSQYSTPAPGFTRPRPQMTTEGLPCSRLVKASNLPRTLI
ncbi:hypothetical protein BKA70DRAFT_795010 [Coprinopsis sp. MPI-PUGE-AT-0042]|nr:hypothetical protein BKA70DRAFT_795010 [Coprinopsis sp. MPI-PUGE-AT-0042]